MSDRENADSSATKTLHEYLQDACHNIEATENNMQAWYSKLSSINDLYGEVIEALFHNPDPWFPTLFLMRAHASLLAASQLVCSAVLPEGYAVMRSTIENALWGFYLWRKPDLAETWIRRNEGPEARRRDQSQLTPGAMKRELSSIDSELGEMCETLYNVTIDYGSHPTLGAVLGNYRQRRDERTITNEMNYFNTAYPNLEAALKSACQVGVFALCVFGLIWEPRLNLTDFAVQLSDLKHGL